MRQCVDTGRRWKADDGYTPRQHSLGEPGNPSRLSSTLAGVEEREEDGVHGYAGNVRVGQVLVLECSESLARDRQLDIADSGVVLSGVVWQSAGEQGTKGGMLWYGVKLWRLWGRKKRGRGLARQTGASSGVLLRRPVA